MAVRCQFSDNTHERTTHFSCRLVRRLGTTNVKFSQWMFLKRHHNNTVNSPPETFPAATVCLYVTHVITALYTKHLVVAYKPWWSAAGPGQVTGRPRPRPRCLAGWLAAAGGCLSARCRRVVVSQRPTAGYYVATHNLFIPALQDTNQQF